MHEGIHGIPHIGNKGLLRSSFCDHRMPACQAWMVAEKA